jgi:hypothetical protein
VSAMPRLLIHALVGFPVFFLVAYMLRPFAGLIFLLSSLLVDIDHLVGYCFITRDWTWNVMTEYENMSKWWFAGSRLPSGELNPKYVRWHFMHRIEPWIVIIFFAPNPLRMIGVGALSNLLLDAIEWPERVKCMTVTTDTARLVHVRS